MRDFEKILIGFAIAFVIKGAYEYGRYSAVHEIYKRGWSVCTNEDKKSENTKQEKES